MSLTRAQWLEMWASVKRLEALILKGIYRTGTSEAKALQEIQLQKDLIQSVLGQLE